MKPADPLLDVADAAEYLSVRESFVRRLVKEHRITVVRPGGRLVRFRQSDLDAFIAEATSEAAAPAVPPVLRLHPRRRKAS